MLPRITAGTINSTGRSLAEDSRSLALETIYKYDQNLACLLVGLSGESSNQSAYIDGAIMTYLLLHRQDEANEMEEVMV